MPMGKYSILIILLKAQINISSQKGEWALKSSLLNNLSLLNAWQCWVNNQT